MNAGFARMRKIPAFKYKSKKKGVFSMKNKLLIVALIMVTGLAFAALSITACGNSGTDETGGSQSSSGGKTPSDGKTPGEQTPGSGGGLGPNNEVPGNTLVEQLSWLKQNVQSNKAYTLTAKADEDISYWGELSYSNKSNITITLKGNGGERIISGTGSGGYSGAGLFRIGSGVTLILEENITLQGSSIGIGMRNEDGAAFTMNGGKITGCSSAVCMISNSTFTMNRGTISGNDCSYYSIVYISGENAIFIMNGGTISGNKSNNVYGVESTIYIRGENAVFTMNNGTIADNSDGGHGNGGVEVHSGTFIMNNGTISGNGPNGIYLYDNRLIFTMNNGTISGNNGRGVYVYGSTFTMNGGKISNNKGGGVLLRGTFTMNGGEISGHNIDTVGSGICLSSSSIFRISNGIVYGSNADPEKANTAPPPIDTLLGYGSAFFMDDRYGKAQYGTGNTWTDIPVKNTASGGRCYRDDTINVVNGVLQ